MTFRTSWLLVVVLVSLACYHQSAAGISSAADNSAAQKAATRDLIGTWRLVEFWDRDSATAPKRYTYGEKPTGYFTYDATGHVSIQIQKGPQPNIIAANRGESWFKKASQEELRAAVESYRAYFGTYTVDLARGIVVHRVEGDSRQLYTGTDQNRTFRLAGDSLIIGNSTTDRRVLLRVH
jgi:hypothetical protein